MHFISSQDKNLTRNLKTISNGPAASLPNSTTIYPTHSTHLPFDNLSSSATNALVYPDITNSSLLSIGQLCDNDCVALFHKHYVKILKDGKVIITGHHN